MYPESVYKMKANSSDVRLESRYLISAYLKRAAGQARPYFKLGTADPIQGEINDISACGLGFRIKGLSFNEVKKLLDKGRDIITIHLDRREIRAEVAIIWCVNLKTDENHLALGGMKIISQTWREKMKWRNIIRKVKRLSQR